MEIRRILYWFPADPVHAEIGVGEHGGQAGGVAPGKVAEVFEACRVFSLGEGLVVLHDHQVGCTDAVEILPQLGVFRRHVVNGRAS